MVANGKLHSLQKIISFLSVLLPLKLFLLHLPSQIFLLWSAPKFDASAYSAIGLCLPLFRSRCFRLTDLMNARMAD